MQSYWQLEKEKSDLRLGGWGVFAEVAILTTRLGKLRKDSVVPGDWFWELGKVGDWLFKDIAPQNSPSQGVTSRIWFHFIDQSASQRHEANLPQKIKLQGQGTEHALTEWATMMLRINKKPVIQEAGESRHRSSPCCIWCCAIIPWLRLRGVSKF